MLSISSITYQWNKGHGREYKRVKHEDVWKLMPHEVKDYGESLRKIRGLCDYHYEENSWNQDEYEKALSTILPSREKMFAQLEPKIRTDYLKFFGEDVADESIQVTDCDAILDEIKELHEKFASQILKENTGGESAGESVNVAP